MPADDDDDDRQQRPADSLRIGARSRPQLADPDEQRAALKYAANLERDALACRFCNGETDQASGRLQHERSCPLR